MRTTTLMHLAAVLAVLVLVGCETDPYLKSYEQAKNGTYTGPATAYSVPDTNTPHPLTRGYNPAMYYGFSTVNTPIATHREDHLAGTFQVPFNPGVGGGVVGYQPTVNQMVNGTSLGVTSTVVPPAGDSSGR